MAPKQGKHQQQQPVLGGKTLEEDVTRRDFTVNAMVVGMKDKKFELIDLVGGTEDFEKGLIRAVGDAEKRFGEDALRMMRAIRFAARLGFAIEENTFTNSVTFCF